MKRKTKICLSVLLAVVLALGVSLGLYANDYYRAENAGAYLTSDAAVTVSRVDGGYFFDGAGEEDALLFYPGAKVEETAYAPLMKQLAADGVDCFLLTMPMKLAIFGVNRAEAIMKAYPYGRYYLAGHSLGGAMAARFAAEHPTALSGLFLLAAYPSEDLTALTCPVKIIYGDADGVMNKQRLEEGFSLLPADNSVVVLHGANHAGFGTYGAQKDDGTASMAQEKQWQLTAESILQTIQS